MILTDLLQDQNPWWRDGAIRRARGYPVRRELQPKVLAQILRDDRRATLLLGPRQVGKTVLLLQLADDLLDKGLPPQNLTYFDFSDERITEDVTARQVVEAQPVGVNAELPRVFLFDEIRGSAKWDRWLKQAVDARVGPIVATDSAAGLLRAGAVESGQGRWDEIYIEGLTFREFLISPLDRYAPDVSANPRAKPKIYAADPGLVTAFALLPDHDPEVRAKSFEANVFRHLREVAQGIEGRLTYFRVRESLEIDFVLESSRGLVAIGVTSGLRLRPDKLERVRRAAKELGADRTLLIHGGSIEERSEGVEAVALQRFLYDPSAVLNKLEVSV